MNTEESICKRDRAKTKLSGSKDKIPNKTRLTKRLSYWKASKFPEVYSKIRSAKQNFYPQKT